MSDYLTDQDVLEWVIRNLLTEEQLDTVPPGSSRSLRWWLTDILEKGTEHA